VGKPTHRSRLRLPDASVNSLGFDREFDGGPYYGRADLPHLADEETVMDELFL